MHRCKLTQADLVVDHMAFRFDNLSELKSSRRLHGFLGVAFPHLEETFNRLDGERKASVRERRKELAQQRKLTEQAVRRVFGERPKPSGN